MQVARRGQRLVKRLARHDDGDGARWRRLGDVRLGEIEDLHVAAVQHAPLVASFADQTARRVELHQIVVEPVGDGLVPVTHEALAVEVDLGDQQAAQGQPRTVAAKPVSGRCSAGGATSKMTEMLSCQASNWSRGEDDWS